MASIKRWLVLLCLSVGLFGLNIKAQDECHFGSEEAFDALVKTLTVAPSCKVAVKKLHDCEWGSSADTQFAPIVIEKCEKDFLAKLPSTAKDRYYTEMQLCAYEYARQEGTMSMSAAAMCQVDVAAEIAANPAKAYEPEPRASFHCDQARTVLEKAICSDIKLGHADIVLSRVYSGLLSSVSKEVRPRLIDEEKVWLRSVPRKCGLSASPMSEQSLNCIRNEFELRFSWLDGCADEDSNNCLQPPSVDEKSGQVASTPRASFDCEAPSTALEVVICADAELGQADIKLASAYHNANAVIPAGEHSNLVKSERSWLRYVTDTCPLGAIGGIPPVITRACVRRAYEERIRQLEICPQKKPQEQIPCLNDFRLDSEPSSNAWGESPSPSRVK